MKFKPHFYPNMSAGRKKTSLRSLASSLKLRFDALDCPYVDGVDDSWISELLFQPGEARIRLLQWLLSRYDAKFAEMLDNQYWTIEAKMDSQIQTMAQLCSYLGLCQAGDLQLIRGVGTSHSKQAEFWDKLLDIVTITDAAEDSGLHVIRTSEVESKNLSLRDQFCQDSLFTTSLAQGQDLHEAFSTKMNLFPPDIAHILIKRTSSQEQSIILPDSEEHMTTHLSMELQQAIQRVKDLQKAYDYPQPELQDMDKIMQTIKLVLSELVQQVTSFIFMFEGEAQQFCNKITPQLTQLGPAVKRVHTLLEHFSGVLDSLQSVYKSYYTIINKRPHESLPAGAPNIMAGHSALQSYSEFVSILDCTVQRQQDTTTESTQHSISMTGKL